MSGDNWKCDKINITFDMDAECTMNAWDKNHFFVVENTYTKIGLSALNIGSTNFSIIKRFLYSFNYLFF